MEKLIIEARVNEMAPRDKNPNVPYLPAEIVADAVACHNAGASILHYHGRAASGAPEHGAAVYLETNAGVRAACPILIHPTLGAMANDTDAKGRFAAVEEMMKDPATAADFAPMDMGSNNVDLWNPEENRFETTEQVYKNPTATLMHFAGRIGDLGLKPYLAAWNVTSTRQIDAFLKMGLIPEPAFICFVLTDGVILAGHPGTPEGLDAHLAFLPEGRDVVWTTMNYYGNLFSLTEKIIRAGGHISIGLGDYPYTEFGAPTNADIIAKVADQARALGREVATVDDTRRILGMPAKPTAAASAAE